MKKLLLFGTLAFGLNAFGQVPNYVPTNGLVSWWGFNGNANDESGTGNDGAVNGATLTTDRFGNPNSAYDFDGVDDEILIPNSGSLTINETTALSFSFWIETSNTSIQRVLSKRNFTGNLGVGMEILTGADSIRFYYGDGPGSYVYEPISNNSIVYNAYTHIVVLVDQNTNLITSYVDGNLESVSLDFSSVTGSIDNISALSIGGTGGGDFPFNGKIDDIGIWNRLLNECEITELFSGQDCNVGIEELTQGEKKLVKIIDFMGRETEYKPNAPLILIYSDGTRERVMKLEE